MNKYYYLFCLCIVTYLSGCDSQTTQNSGSPITKSEIRSTEEGYRIFLNGEPFYVKGAGVDKNASAENLVYHGANAIRTWSTERGEEILDMAHERGLKVMMGIWVSPERHGFDFNDEDAIKRLMKEIRKRVEKLKDHPALMVWGIGNELNHHSENPKVWDVVNDISEMIHELDPNHLTTTCLAGLRKKYVDLVASRAQDLDFLCIQMYAPIDRLPEIIEESTYTGPLLVTEWGATGYWEVPETSWGAPIENHSSKKADLYLKRYQNSIQSQAQQVMGSFVFYWGQKQERTPTWFGMFMPDGNETESVDMMHYAWKGEWPENRTPRLHDFTLEGKHATDNIKLKAGETYSAKVQTSDPDNDSLNYRWEIMEESKSTKTGGDKEEIPAVLEELFDANADSISTFKSPSDTGAYRLFIYVEDGNKHTAHANIPFWVESPVD